MVLMLNQRVAIAMEKDAYQFAIILLLQILVSTRNTKFCSDDRVVRASASGAVDSDLIPNRV